MCGKNYRYYSAPDRELHHRCFHWSLTRNGKIQKKERSGGRKRIKWLEYGDWQSTENRRKKRREREKNGKMKKSVTGLQKWKKWSRTEAEM